MKWLLFIVFSATALAGDLALTNGSRVVIFGDSITDAHFYSDYLATWWLTQNPDKLLHIYVEGRGGDSWYVTATTGSIYDTTHTNNARYERRAYALLGVSPAQSNFCTVMFGHNGDQTSANFVSNAWIFSTNYVIGSNSATPVLLGTNPKDLATGGTATFQSTSTNMAYVGTVSNWPASDTIATCIPVFTNNAGNGLLGFSGDTTHPGAAGHLRLAFAIIKNLGGSSNISSVTINAANLTCTASNGASISNITGTSRSFSFVRRVSKIPMAWDLSASNCFVALPDSSWVPNETLTISNLTSGTYSITEDGTNFGTYSSATLAAGINLATNTATPDFAYRLELLGKFRDLHGIDRTNFDRLIPHVGVSDYDSNADGEYQTSNLRGSALISALSDEVAALLPYDTNIFNAAQPLPRTFTVTRVEQGTLAIGRKVAIGGGVNLR